MSGFITRPSFTKAEKLYGHALANIRDNPAIWFNHGLVLRDLGRPQEALASFDHALRLGPPMAEIENERANALLELGRAAEALAALDRSLALRLRLSRNADQRGLALMAMAREAGHWRISTPCCGWSRA